MYSKEIRMTTAAMARIRKWKNTLNPSILTIFQKATPGDCAMLQVAQIPATAPSRAIAPSVFRLCFSSNKGSRTMITMPKTERTISGKIRR